MRSKRSHRRRFLNRRGHHAGAFVLAECKIDVCQARTELDAYVTIAYCGRMVTLDFSGSTTSEISNALPKTRTLRDALVGSAPGLVRAL